MRDVGGLVWIVFVLVAVISSIVRSARKVRPTAQREVVAPSRRVPPSIVQFAQQAQTHAPPPSMPKPVPPAPPVAPVVAAPRPVEPVVAAPQPRQAHANRFFSDRGALVRGIIAAEVLGKPLALRDE